MSTTKQILNNAINLISKGWCQNVSALKADNTKTTFDSNEAVCFCAMGAIARSAHDLHGTDWKQHYGETLNIVTTWFTKNKGKYNTTANSIQQLNDTTNKAIISQVLRDCLFYTIC